MASNNLASVSPASTYPQLLHIGTGSLSSGALLRLGDGTATVLTLSTTGLTVAGALTTNTAGLMGGAAAGITLTRLGTVARSQALADAPGTLHPVIRFVVNATTASTSTTPAALPLTWENGSALAAGTYLVRGSILCQSAATTTGCQLRLDGPSAQTGSMALTWSQGYQGVAQVNSWGTLYASSSSFIAGYPFMQTLDGIVTLTADSTTVPSLYLASEVGGSSVQVFAGSFIEFERIL